MRYNKANLEVSKVITIIIGILVLVLVLILFVPGITDSAETVFGITGSKSPDYYMRQGDASYVEGNFGKAREYYAKIIDINKKSPDEATNLMAADAQLKISLCWAAQEAYPDAKENLNLILTNYKSDLDSATTSSVQATITKAGSLSRGNKVTWECCDFGKLGNVYAYGVCTKPTKGCSAPPDMS